MKRLSALLLILTVFATGHAQIHEVGVFLGGANYIGDIGPTTYIAPKDPAIGFLYKWNRSPRHSWRASLTHARVSSNDLDSDMPARKLRGLSFKNDITEASVGLEFNFFDFNLHDLEPKFTPYVYTGLSYTLYKGLFFLGNETRSDATHGNLAIPMTVGIKGRLFPHLVLGIEAGARYLFADDLDGSNPTNKNLSGQAFGNMKSDDWYVFTGFTLTYTFGNKPCYCAE